MTKDSSEFSTINKYGYRGIAILVILLIFSTDLLVEFFQTGEAHGSFLFLAVLFYIITLLLFVGLSMTITKRVDKKYFHVKDELVGRSGNVMLAAKHGERGTIHIDHEDWSFFSDDDLVEGDTAEVVAVHEDNNTLKVRKISV